MMCGKEASDVHCQSARCSSEDEVSVRADKTVPRNVSKKEVIITLIKTASPIPTMLPLSNPDSALGYGPGEAQGLEGLRPSVRPSEDVQARSLRVQLRLAFVVFCVLHCS